MDKTAKESPILVCCYHGNSSQNAAHYLSEQGYTNVHSLNGGYEQWKVIYPDACQS
jgi:thiosulfate sulfurtransferase